MPKIVREKVYGVAEALISLRPNARWGLGSNGTYEEIQWQDSDITVPSKEEVEAEILKLQSEWNTTQYQRLRMAAYPNIEDQLDQIYHEGIDKWKETIAAIKAQYPKPEEQ